MELKHSSEVTYSTKEEMFNKEFYMIEQMFNKYRLRVELLKALQHNAKDYKGFN